MIKQIPITNDEIYDLSAFAFQSSPTREEIEQKKKAKQYEIVWGWLEDEKLAAKLHIIPLEAVIHGKDIKTGGISSVATWPEYRRKGIVRKLIAHALKEMKEEGQLIAYLHPFHIPFYRQFGWELTFNEMVYTIPIEKLPKRISTDGYVQRMNKGEEFIVKEVYQQYTGQYTGMLKRDDHWWEYKIFATSFLTAISYAPDGKPDGYIRYKVEKNKVDIDEWVTVTPGSKKRLLQFIANHDSMAKEVQMVAPDDDLLLLFMGDQRFKQVQEPYFMTRIVDVEAFLAVYPFANREKLEGTYTIEVNDPFFSENTGVYQLDFREGKHVAKKKGDLEGTPTVSVTVQQLAQILLGNTSIEKLYQQGLLSGDKAGIASLAQFIPETHPYLPDFF